jgi:hypothetical protein
MRARNDDVLFPGAEKPPGDCASDIDEADSLDERHISVNCGLQTPRLLDIQRISAADVLIAYLRNSVPRRRRPIEAAARIGRLSEFFGAKMLPEINGSLCREYVAVRRSVQAARRELADLRAAINQYFADELVRPTIRIEMPPLPRRVSGG